MRWIAIAAVLLGGCSEYEVSTDQPALGDDDGALGPGAGDGSGDGSGQGGFGDGWGDGDGGADGGGELQWHEPEIFIDDDCADGIVVSWLSGEIAVLSWDEPRTGQMEVPQAGTYDVYDIAIAESGDRQWNESAYLRIPSGARPHGLPLFGNCNDEWIVQDPDNLGPLPAGTAMYMGTFRLDQGVVDVELHHLCPMVRNGTCTSMHNTDDPGSTCDTDNPNSVHLTGAALCLRPVP